jgi:SAM-dependent methyltransferase
MAVPADLAYLRSVLPHVGPDVLEIGSRAWQGDEGNMRSTIVGAGRRWEGCDLEEGPGVDFTIDILDDDRVAGVGRTWSTVLLFNLLEHVYDPPHALRNALRLVGPGGTCVVCGPAIWELHDFPADYWRPMPDFYVEFARREGLSIVPGTLCWVLNEFRYLPGRPPATRAIPVDDLVLEGQKQVPARLTAAAVYGRGRTVASIALQRALNLTGRVTRFPNVGLGVVLQLPSSR